MIHRLNIVLDQTEYTELVSLSLKELRTPADQARHILRQILTPPGVPSPDILQSTASRQLGPKP